MTLSPQFIIWDVVFFTQLAIAGGVGWLFFHTRIIRLWRHLLISDAVALWLGFGLGYHLWLYMAPSGISAHLHHPTLWAFSAALGGYMVFRVLGLGRGYPRFLAKPTPLFAYVIVVWALVAGAGYNAIDDLEKARNDLKSVTQAQIISGRLPVESLELATTLHRVPPEALDRTHRLLARIRSASSTQPVNEALAVAFRLRSLPLLLEGFRLQINRFQLYQGIQLLLMVMMLLIWGFGVKPFVEKSLTDQDFQDA